MATIIDGHLHTLSSFRQDTPTQPLRDAPRRSHESSPETITVVAPARQTTDWRWLLAHTTVTWLPNTAWVLLLLRKVTSTQPRWPHTWPQAFTPTWCTHPLQLILAVWMWTTAVRDLCLQPYCAHSAEYYCACPFSFLLIVPRPLVFLLLIVPRPVLGSRPTGRPLPPALFPRRQRRRV